LVHGDGALKFRCGLVVPIVAEAVFHVEDIACGVETIGPAEGG
jgi:hypothetical protein